MTLVVQKWDHKAREWEEPEAEGELDEMSTLEAYAIVESYVHTAAFRVIHLDNKDEYRIYFNGKQVVNDW